MSEILRYITLDVGGRPIVVQDLNDMERFTMARDSFQTMPAGKQSVMSNSARRYGGERQVAETTANGKISWMMLVEGASADDCIATVESFLSNGEANPLGLWLEWRPDGASQSALHEVRGTAEWKCLYKWSEFAGFRGMQFEVSVPVAPLVCGLPMDVLDSFQVNTIGDYTYDAGEAAKEEVKGGTLEALAGAANTERRAIHTARGYIYGDNQQTIQGAPAPAESVTGWKLGCVLKRIDASNYIEVYVDDEGTHSRLRIDKIIAGSRTNLATTNLAARVKSSVAHWVRARLESAGTEAIVTAEYFTGAPTPMGAPTSTIEYELKAGVEDETFGSTVKGGVGRVWIPEHTGAVINEYAVEPYTYRKAALPAQIALSGSIPGDAPATADATITTSGGTSAPIWALLGISNRPGSGLAAAPFGIIQASTGGNLSGWSSGSASGSHSGSVLRDAAAVSTDVYSASWPVDPSLLVPDEFTSEVAVEVWARITLDSTIVTPSLTLSTQPEDGLSYGSARYTDEWGSAGKLLVVPSSGTNIWRFTRLGTLRMLVDPPRPRKWLIWLAGSVGPGSSGAWGVDYLLAVPALRRSCSPSSKPLDETYPKFITSTSETSKTIKPDLSALVAKPPAYGHPDHGLGGQLLELPPGDVDLLVKLSSLVPDDPSANSASEQTSHSATVQVAMTPRWYLARTGS